MTRRDSLKLLGLLGLGAALPNTVRRALAVERPVTQYQAIADATAGFGCDLFAKLRSKDGNLFFSPLSIETALAMTSLGARGETLAEMNKVLQLPAARAHSGVGAYLNSLQTAPGAKYELAVANALWLQQGMPFRPEFLTQSKTYYQADPHSIDFAQAENARQTINHWVEEKTKDKIKDLFAPGTLSAVNRLVLTNAIYFKGKWAHPFEKSMTKDEPFHVTGDKTVKAPLMRRWSEYQYFAGKGVQVVDLPYAGDRISMLVILPAAADGLPAIEKALTEKQLASWVAKLAHKPGEVLMPRFTTTDKFDLGDTLQDMGMKRAFSNDADFSGMSPEQIMITRVVHKAFVDTNEEGSVAAAATGVALEPKAAVADPVTPFTFRADHPFLFLIRHERSGSILFLGRVMNPGKS